MFHSRATTAILLTASLAACAPETTAMATAADPATLDGTAWVLAALPGQAVAAGRFVTLRFESGRAQGHDGCNRFTTPYTASGSTLEVSSPGASTLMACPPELAPQAEAFRAALAGAKAWRIEKGQLELLAGDGRVLASFAPQPSDLTGTSWNATAINNGKQAVASVVADSTVTLEFLADGSAAGSAGCNRYTATWAADGSKLTFGPAAATRKMCVRPEVMQQEQNFLAALGSVAAARFEGDRLELRTAAGALALIFERVSRR